ncbi:protein phosphatase 2C domain-containing protein [Streptomyces sp. NBC_00047]|uniref:protein phosphatase 2C domain-containing protein n=1 Tax=Streptomyces sp. NBC_00047 TaxID=2975627 RepID=UPI00225AE169|nr:protein phosphatase 2C domain-containing protein [Streptomyces sp. NBC_00047]MCX5611484.1 protein phosphatase 2C domain-containing protein [Streptomyces sp. NBC_00047]
MSQQGADDWWQKLYEDPEAGPAPDPGDTLDHRFRSAAGLTTDPGPGPGPGAGPEAAAGAVSAPGHEPVRPSPPPAPPKPPPAPEALLPGPRRSPPPPPPGWPPAPPSAAVPPPRDPRQQDATGYALGGVDVPPVRAPEPPPELPVWRWEVPRAETPERPAEAAPPAPPPGAAPAPVPEPPAAGRPEVRHLGDRAPTYAAEPGALPPADPAALDGLTPDTVLEGARYGTYTLRAASLRGDSARFRGEARRDFLLTARFGGGDDALVLVALAGGDRAAPGAAEAAAELCRTVAAAVGRSQERLADDIRAGRRDALRSGLQRLTDRGYGRLRARAAELGLAEEAYTAGLRGLLLPVDPECRTRVCFGSGAGGLFRLRSGEWRDLEPVEERTADPRRPGEPGEPADPADGGFRFRASVAHPGDTLLLCSGGLAEPMREEPVLPAELAARWAEPEPPGLAAFLADTQLRLKGYADDRTAAAVWEA